MELLRAQPLGVTRPRALWIDVGRGLALAAMVVYHGAFDTVLFGLTDWPVATHPAWRSFAAAIASSFIFLSGVSLVYAHGAGIRWRAFLRRLAVLVLAAAAVSLATALTMPAPIYFGILHAIATFSVLGLPFLVVPPVITIAVAVAVLTLPAVWRSDVFAHPLFYPVGLAPEPPFTFDYEPIFPWFAVTLLGIAAAQLVGPSPGARARPTALAPLAWAGRNSLVLYLVHQPVLFALLFAVTTLVHRG